MSRDRRDYWLEILAIEGEVSQIWDEAKVGTEEGDDIFIAEIEYDLDE